MTGEKSHTFQMRVSDDWLAVIDDWRAAQRPVLSRAEAIRRLSSLGIGAKPILHDLLDLMERLPHDGDLDVYIASLKSLLA